MVEEQWEESPFSYWPEARHRLGLELSGPRAGWFHVYGPEIESRDLVTQGAEAA